MFLHSNRYGFVGTNVPGAMPTEVTKWLDGAGKLDKKPWKGRNGWMGWSTMLFAGKDDFFYQ